MPFNVMDLFQAGNQLGQAQAGPLSYAGENLMDMFKRQQELNMMLGMKAAEKQLPMSPLEQSEVAKNKSFASLYSGPSADVQSIGSEDNPIVEASGGFRYKQEQSKLFDQANSRLSSVRGDSSLKQIESQRDASIMAYNTLNRIKSENRAPSKGEYYDTIAQLYKARTGTAPTNDIIRDLDTNTFKGDLLKGASYWTGKPMGNTTQDVVNNLMEFVKDSGMQADKLHDAYMAPHLVKPPMLDNNLWKQLERTHRGLSFQEGTGLNQQQIRGTENSRRVQAKALLAARKLKGQY